MPRIFLASASVIGVQSVLQSLGFLLMPFCAAGGTELDGADFFLAMMRLPFPFGTIAA